MSMFKEVADIQTADMLKLPVPEAEYKNIAVKPSDIQSEMVKSLSKRAEKVRNGGVDSSQDNMLLITNDGRKLALDQRMIDPLLPDFEGSKVNALVDNVYRIWDETTPNKSAQLIFCDLSTPKSSNDFSVYNDIRDKLIKKGVPPDEVQFIHDANTETKKTSVYKGYKQDKIEMRGDRAEMSDFPLYLNTVAGGLDRRDQTIGGFSFVVKIYAVPVVEIIG